ncbi:polysaccharide pyruvyl transferase family protein [Porifericola rhodea]|uniref:polysaccharide pyruvyl transferase family protein n=1 Tax=Porifericola rhodea TaxID=930972 RepID=UPI0026657480|nr:polysaccharide pyruvyl transferase family protein [Porifericola rhodea]WKN29790.1 polysaccharide pyruvyl transferase family protein [Porifericola rhodea]
MKISFITTVNHNVGDDFIREGLKFLLRKRFEGRAIEFANIHKHSPITSRNGFEKVRSLRQSERWDRRLPLWITTDKILSADIVVQSGAPVYWYHEGITDCVKGNEWYDPLIKWRYRKKQSGALYNLAAGACQTYNSDGTEFLNSPKVCDYIKEFHSLCQATTVRDKLAQDVLKQLGLKAQLIPCSSIFAADEYALKDCGSEYVVLNYMSGGGHFSFGQSIDFSKWQREFKKFYQILKQKEKVVFSCHNQKEIQEAKDLDPQAEIFFSENYLDYMKFYSRAKFGFMNRIHASYQLSSYGKPSLIVGADTRARMATEIGNTAIFVEDATAEVLLETYNTFLQRRKDYKEQFSEIKKAAFNDYMSVLEDDAS